MRNNSLQTFYPAVINWTVGKVKMAELILQNSLPNNGPESQVNSHPDYKTMSNILTTTTTTTTLYAVNIRQYDTVETSRK